MKLTVHEIEEISRSVATEYGGELSIAGVTAADGEADHAELLISIPTGEDDEAFMVEINVPRGTRAEMESALRDRFRAALAEQRQRAVVEGK